MYTVYYCINIMNYDNSVQVQRYLCTIPVLQTLVQYILFLGRPEGPEGLEGEGAEGDPMGKKPDSLVSSLSQLLSSSASIVTIRQ